MPHRGLGSPLSPTCSGFARSAAKTGPLRERRWMRATRIRGFDLRPVLTVVGFLGEGWPPRHRVPRLTQGLPLPAMPSAAGSWVHRALCSQHPTRSRGGVEETLHAWTMPGSSGRPAARGRVRSVFGGEYRIAISANVLRLLSGVPQGRWSRRSGSLARKIHYGQPPVRGLGSPQNRRVRSARPVTMARAG
jgi:hypothetical protein